MDLIITILPVVTKRIFPSLPGSRLTIFYRDASSALLQLVNQWLNFTYSRSHAFRYERKNTNPTLVRIELTTSALAGVQVNYKTTRATSNVYPLVLQHVISRNSLQQNVSTDSPTTTFLQLHSKHTTHLVTHVTHLNMFISFAMFYRDSSHTSPFAQSYQTSRGKNEL